MVVIGVAGSDPAKCAAFSQQFARGRYAPVWSFADMELQAARALFCFDYDQCVSESGRAAVDPVFGVSVDDLVKQMRGYVPLAVWQRRLVKRLAGAPPCNFVFISDVTEEWQAGLVRDLGGMVLHLAEWELALDSPVTAKGDDLTFDENCFSLEWLDAAFPAAVERGCQSFDLASFVAERLG